MILLLGIICVISAESFTLVENHTQTIEHPEDINRLTVQCNLKDEFQFYTSLKHYYASFLKDLLTFK